MTNEPMSDQWTRERIAAGLQHGHITVEDGLWLLERTPNDPVSTCPNGHGPMPKVEDIWECAVCHIQRMWPDPVVARPPDQEERQ